MPGLRNERALRTVDRFATFFRMILRSGARIIRDAVFFFMAGAAKGQSDETENGEDGFHDGLVIELTDSFIASDGPIDITAGC